MEEKKKKMTKDDLLTCWLSPQVKIKSKESSRGCGDLMQI